MICSPERERNEVPDIFAMYREYRHNPTVYRINSINTCPVHEAQDTSYMARHRAFFAAALRRHKSRPMMGYMCRRHATVSCENVSRDPMGPPDFYILFASKRCPASPPSFPRVYMALRVTSRSSSSSRLSSACFWLLFLSFLIFAEYRQRYQE